MFKEKELFRTREKVLVLDSAKALMSKVLAYLPKIVFATLIILFGWLIALIFSKIIDK